MSRLTFFFKRLSRMDWAKMWETTGELKRKSGKSRPWLLADMMLCGLRYNAGYVDYKIAQMYRLDRRQRASTITRGISNNIVRRMNDKAYWHCFDDKSEFNSLFREWVRRDFMRFDENTSVDDLKAFLADKPQVFVKPLEGSSGVGVSCYGRESYADIAAFHAQLRELGQSILEEKVIQHEKMSTLCPTSVNTVRIATLIGDKEEGIVYAFLRIGNGKIMDNVDCGGMACRVDLETGRITTPAADKKGNVYDRHPMTDVAFYNFKIPYFEEAKQMCLEAMRLVPQVRYVAWDVAIGKDGPCFIEGNSFPSHAVPQFAAHYPDGMGILTEFRRFIDC